MAPLRFCPTPDRCMVHPIGNPDNTCLIVKDGETCTDSESSKIVDPGEGCGRSVASRNRKRTVDGQRGGMEARRFDELTQALARRQTRRGVFACVAFLFALFGARASVSAAVQDDCPGGCPAGEVCRIGACWTACETHRDCRSKHDDPCILNTCEDGICRSAMAGCLPGYECCKGECCPKSCKDHAECAVFDPCRRGECAPDGFCSFVIYEPCEPCQSDAECATGHGLNTTCCAGMCKRPCPVGTVMGKGCECEAHSPGTQNGLVVRDDASG